MCKAGDAGFQSPDRRLIARVGVTGGDDDAGLAEFADIVERTDFRRESYQRPTPLSSSLTKTTTQAPVESCP